MNAHEEIERTFTIDANVAEAFPLFGPFGEREWASDWNPQVIWTTGAGDREGMIFRNGTTEPVWITLRFDRDAGVAEYVHFTRDVVTRIRVDVLPARDGTSRSRASVRYAWTALTLVGEGHVRQRKEHVADDLETWAPMINAALARRAPSVRDGA